MNRHPPPHVNWDFMFHDIHLYKKRSCSPSLVHRFSFFKAFLIEILWHWNPWAQGWKITCFPASFIPALCHVVIGSALVTLKPLHCKFVFSCLSLVFVLKSFYSEHLGVAQLLSAHALCKWRKWFQTIFLHVCVCFRLSVCAAVTAL